MKEQPLMHIRDPRMPASTHEPVRCGRAGPRKIWEALKKHQFIHVTIFLLGREFPELAKVYVHADIGSLRFSRNYACAAGVGRKILCSYPRLFRQKEEINRGTHRRQ
uniref:Uncharacterized protein n=1 Tax=Trichogramma kaykai TaxID=54128 RepID=A0ABD2WIN9_9HYME